MAKDLIHNAIKNALKKDDWDVVADPYRLDYKNFILKADLAVEKPAENSEKKIRIIVEVKSFAGKSFVREFQQALGQYTMYLDAIAMNQLDFELYLGISEDAYQNYFLQSGTLQEEIVEWID